MCGGVISSFFGVMPNLKQIMYNLKFRKFSVLEIEGMTIQELNFWNEYHLELSRQENKK